MVKSTSKKITSLQNPLVKHFAKINQSRSYREEHQLALVSGDVVIGELQESHEIHTLLTLEESSLSAKESFIVTAEILKKITDLSSPPSMVAAFSLPKASSLEKKKKLIACEEMSDPGNLGTLIRSALAFGWEGILLLGSSVDLFNNKVMRASRGGSFLLPYQSISYEELRNFKDHSLLVADIEGRAISEMKAPEKMILLLGNEAKGPSIEMKKLGERITIPMSKKTESLNVAVAGSILMYLLGSP